MSRINESSVARRLVVKPRSAILMSTLEKWIVEQRVSLRRMALILEPSANGVIHGCGECWTGSDSVYRRTVNPTT
jgi:hypothetical protein